MKILITGGNGNIATIVKNNLDKDHNITALPRDKLNILNYEEINTYLSKNEFDILIHTAILGGRRTKEENGDVVHYNLIMLENILKFSHKFKMIINFDSAAIYDRKTDILNRSENELYTIPTDYYGFSKYVTYMRSLQYNNFYNFRIFNIFYVNEEPDRFIKACFLTKKNNTDITIFEDKYFDFVYEIDFIHILNYYINNIENKEKLHKTINICYEDKYKLSDIAKLIIQNDTKINIIKKESINNYSGNNSLLQSLHIPLMQLEKSLEIYKNNLLL
jgi:GDP-L-fucose synthase